MTPRLRPYQMKAIEAARREIVSGKRSVLLVCPTGGGKCIGPEVKVLRYDGRVVRADEVQAGDLLMGPDSKPRTVLSTCRGEGEVFRVVPVKGEPWTCNDAHVLTLVHTETNEVVDIPLDEYLSKSKYWRHCHKQFSVGVDFAERSDRPSVDPYFFGLWVGDGTKGVNDAGHLRMVAISKPDAEVLRECEAQASMRGLHVRTSISMSGGCPTHHIVNARGAGNRLLAEMRAILAGRISIPEAYLFASRKDRLALLAGILDSDGYLHSNCFEVAQKNRDIAAGICFLARSLGFRALRVVKVVNGEEYQRISISGETSEIPTRIPRKQATPRGQKKSANRTGFSVEPIGVGPYCGWELDGDGRYLMGDFTVTHNTVVASDIIRSAVGKGSRTLFLAHRRELIHQTRDKLRSFGVEPGIIMAGEPMALSAPCQVASIQTLAQRRDVLTRVDLIFFDEAHHAAAKTYKDAAKLFPGAKVVGLTATPWRSDGKGLADIFDSHVVVATPAELRDGGYLCPVGGWEFRSIAMDDAQVRGGDFVQSSMSEAGRDVKLLGSIVGEYVARANGRPGICFCVSVAASESTALAFREAGVAAEHLDGETPREERDAILARLRSGETKMVTNCAVLTEGFDFPSLEVCILASPTLSPGLYLQRVGRVLRPAPGKERAIIHDHCKSLATHGHPYEERDYAPCEADPERSVNKRRKDTESKVKTCPSCGSVRFGWPCPSCGHQPPESEIAEELRVEAVEIVEKKRTADELVRADRFKAMSEAEKKDAFMRMVLRHGKDTRKSVGVYRWQSGDTAWPPREWQVEAGVPQAKPNYLRRRKK